MLFFLSSSSYCHCFNTQAHTLSFSRPMCTQMKRRLHFFYCTIHSSLWLFSHFLLRRMRRWTYNGMEWCALVYFEIWFSHFVHHIFFSLALYLFCCTFFLLWTRWTKDGEKRCHIRMSLSLFTETWITIRWCILAGCFSCCVRHSAFDSQLVLVLFFSFSSSLAKCSFMSILIFPFDLKIRRVMSWNISITKHHFHLALYCFCSITSQTNKNEKWRKKMR